MDSTSGGILFIVGSEAEVGALERAGYRAMHAPDGSKMDGAALSMAGRGDYAVLCLNGEAAWTFSTVLEAAGVPYHSASHGWDGYEDLQQDLVQEWADVEAGAARSRMDEARALANRKQLERLGVHDVFGVSLEIASGTADRERIPTGIDDLDEALGGGLPVGGLVTIGATSSTGKTTLTLQIVDNIASSGHPALFVTIEQGRHELVAKSLSRLMYLRAKRNGWYSVGSAEVQSSTARSRWDEDTRAAFDAVCAEYNTTIAPNLYIMETDKQPTVEDIRKAARAIERQRGQAPVVAVDYLQLLAPVSDKLTDKQSVDRNVMSLRHLARDMPTCVIAISSLNRSSYSTGVTLESFKESGAVEYGSDVLLGLQPVDLNDRLDNVSEARQRAEARKVEREFKRKINREVVVTILKNRSGAVDVDGVRLDYNAKSNVFKRPKEARPVARGSVEKI